MEIKEVVQQNLKVGHNPHRDTGYAPLKGTQSGLRDESLSLAHAFREALSLMTNK